MDRWHAVDTRADGSVARLNLTDNGLTGAIPAELDNLSGPAELHLDYNGLTGAIPAELGNLSSLPRLNLNDNRLTGAIPAELGNLTGLVGLDLGDNELTGVIPNELRNLDDLLVLYLSGNRLSGCVPYGLRDISVNDLDQLGLLFCEDIDRAALTALYDSTAGYRWRFQYNWRSDAPVGDWHGVYTDENDRVRAVHLAGNLLIGTLPAELGDLSELTALRLWDNRLSGGIPPELGRLPNLTELTLDDNHLSGGIPPSWAASITWLNSLWVEPTA